jgi:spoIIIJ-associated protein
MEQIKQTIQKLLALGGFSDFSVEVEPEGRRISVLIYDVELKSFLPKLIWDFEHIINLVSKRNGWENFVVDINNYRRERERLIGELAKAAARKVLLSKEAVSLPAMNAYERRLIHLELASRPDVKTESLGEGKERHVVVKPL